MARHNQRIEMIEKFVGLSVEVGGMTSMEIDSKCLFTKEVIAKG
jgi:hypothetical protein